MAADAMVSLTWNYFVNGRDTLTQGPVTRCGKRLGSRLYASHIVAILSGTARRRLFVRGRS